MIIQISLDYMSDSVACFDPEKVLWKLSELFPEAIIDEKDYAEVEVQSLASFLTNRGEEITERREAQMLASIKRKARQNGPAFIFMVDSGSGENVSGWARRYGVGFKSGKDIPNDLKARIISFLEGLDLGEVSIS
jgi:hypothetical protein